MVLHLHRPRHDHSTGGMKNKKRTSRQDAGTLDSSWILLFGGAIAFAAAATLFTTHSADGEQELSRARVRLPSSKVRWHNNLRGTSGFPIISSDVRQTADLAYKLRY